VEKRVATLDIFKLPHEENLREKLGGLLSTPKQLLVEKGSESITEGSTLRI